MDASDTSFELLRRSIGGDREATDMLCARLRPGLKRWASGRLPVWAQDGIDTEDLVQEALTRTLGEPGRLEARPDFQAYIHQVILNSIRDHVRRTVGHRRAAGETVENHPDPPSPLEELIGQEKLDRYDAALGRLSPEDREAIVCRVELGLSYKEIAEATGRPSPDAARMAVARALVRLSREMGDEP